MSDQGEPAIEQSRVTRLLDDRQEKLDSVDLAEFYLMQTLWELRGSYSIDEMASWTGWSRQTLYNKWDKHGFKRLSNAKSTRD